MSRHTTFRVGGPAEYFCIPIDFNDMRTILEYTRTRGIPFFILGGGANILVSDSGIPGFVIDMSAFRSIRLEPEKDGAVITAGAGLPISDAAEFAAEAGFSGLENFFSMPGSLGGAVYMNARCYGRSISDILLSVCTMTENGTIINKNIEPKAFDYKKSPFQNTTDIILEASFHLSEADPAALKAAMADFKKDRESKGHFQLPSAGSVFKNNRQFGEPTGILVDRLGLKGCSIGGAKISDLHGNIIVNTGSATAVDIRNLIELVERKVFEAFGFRLEREVKLIGTFPV